MNEEDRRRQLKKWIALTTAFFIAILLVLILCYLIWWRSQEKTDDAYVNGNIITITPKQKGIVTTILADNTLMVEEGQPLIELDKTEYEIALNRTKAELGSAVRDVVQMFVKVRELEAKRDARRSDFLRTCLDYKHRKELVLDQSVSQEDFEHSQTALFSAFSTLRETDQELEAARARVGNTTIPKHPAVERAKTNLQQAFLELRRCEIRSPARGIITQRKAQAGSWVGPSDALMSLVPVDQIWVDANYRETDLKNLRVGQPVRLYSDMYGKKVSYHGKIIGLNPGTGSIFSILPPQNASGNWIKIIQRIPVKISLEPDQIKKFPLILGLSMTATADTHDQSGPRLGKAGTDTPIYQTDAYALELDGADEMIDQIIKENIALNDYK